MHKYAFTHAHTYKWLPVNAKLCATTSPAVYGSTDCNVNVCVRKYSIYVHACVMCVCVHVCVNMCVDCLGITRHSNTATLTRLPCFQIRQTHAQTATRTHLQCFHIGQTDTHTHTHTQERERDIERGLHTRAGKRTHTHTQAHTCSVSKVTLGRHCSANVGNVPHMYPNSC